MGSQKNLQKLSVKPSHLRSSSGKRLVKPLQPTEKYRKHPIWFINRYWVLNLHYGSLWFKFCHIDMSLICRKTLVVSLMLPARLRLGLRNRCQNRLPKAVVLTPQTYGSIGRIFIKKQFFLPCGNHLSIYNRLEQPRIQQD